MFLGHFAVGLAGRSLTRNVSLGTWFLAAQLVDLIWPVLLLAGVEHVRIAPGITAFTPLDFYDYPFTHSLVGVIVWAALLAGINGQIHRNRQTAMLLGGGVLSHWILDWITHRPDLPILHGGPYVGLGLWNSVPGTMAVELTMFLGGLWLYARSRRPTTSFWVLTLVLFVIYLGAAFGPPPPDVRTLALTALAAWLFVGWAWYVDRR